MAARPRKYTDAPMVSPLPYGLWSVVQETIDDDPHWQNGVQFQPAVCAPAKTTVADCPPPDDDSPGTFDKEPGPGLATVGADTFTVYQWVPCPPVGGTRLWEERQATAAAALTAGEARAVEYTFWTGQIDTPDTATLFPHLASDSTVFDPDPAVEPDAFHTPIQTAATVLAGGAAVDVVEAVGLLEEAMAGCYPGTPILHTPRNGLAHLASFSLLTRSGGQLRTPSDSLVAAGGGYPGTGPDGAEPAYPNVWMYATGAIVGRRTGIRLPTREEAFDRRKNDMVAIAERTYQLAWDCCHFAVQVHLGGQPGGAPLSSASA